MTDKLPPNLLKLFAPRPPLPHAQPLDKAADKRVGARVSGIADIVPMLRTYDLDYVPWKSVEERRREKMAARRKKAEEHLVKALAQFDPENDEKMEGNPFNTLFVARLSYELTESDLMREFELYGPIKNIRLVKTQQDKSRGYAFIEYEREKDMRVAAYKDADGLKMLGRRVIVDVERGRTVKGWKPRRLGGGLGGTRDTRLPQGTPRGENRSSYSDSHRDRGQSRMNYEGRGFGNSYNGQGFGRRETEDRRRSRARSRSRSPHAYRDRERDRYSGRGRERSRDRMGGRRDRDRYA
ncbi:hypothetical protein BDF14DRAFT_1743790 [Spinellus fusiger]|nr:hypothetical protein BDF14DRAFT_1743790 [Spinellus fusiger]